VSALLVASSGNAAVGFLIIAALLALVVFEVAALWKVFVKGGRPGWAAIIPIYNLYTLVSVVGRSGWWVILLLIPYVGFVFLIFVDIDLAKSFAKRTGFAVGLIFLPFIFIPILGFGPSAYVGPAGAAPKGVPVEVWSYRQK